MPTPEDDRIREPDLVQARNLERSRAALEALGARVWSEALGRPVAYVGDDDAAVEEALSTHLDGHRRDDWLFSFKALRGFAVTASAAELAGTERLLGRPPTDFTEFVSRVVAEHGAAVARTA